MKSRIRKTISDVTVKGLGTITANQIKMLEVSENSDNVYSVHLPLDINNIDGSILQLIEAEKEKAKAKSVINECFPVLWIQVIDDDESNSSSVGTAIMVVFNSVEKNMSTIEFVLDRSEQIKLGRTLDPVIMQKYKKNLNKSLLS